MTIQEKINQSEEKFNKLKETYIEKETALSQLQTELAEIEKQLIFIKGGHQALTELVDEESKEDSASETK